MAKSARHTSWHHWFFLMIFRIIFGPFFRLYYRFKAKPISLKQHGPYLILANHTAEFDIIFLDMLFDRPLYFVASDQLLNSGKGSWFLRTFFNPIPKSKSVADLTVVRRMQSVLNEGGNVAIFPEGNASIDGGPSRIPPGMGRLLKFLNVPVKVIRIQGLYFSSPRWSYHRKFGPSTMQEYASLSIDDIQSRSPEDLDIWVKESLNASAYDTPLGLYQGKKRAEGLHKLIFTCPGCGSLFSTASKLHQVFCLRCAWQATYDTSGYLHTKQTRLPLTEIHALVLNTFDQSMQKQSEQFMYSTAVEVAFWDGGKTRRSPFKKARMTLDKKGVLLRLKNKEEVILWEDLYAQAIQVRTKLLMYVNNRPTILCRFPRDISHYGVMNVMKWYQHYAMKGDQHDHTHHDVRSFLGL